MEAIIRIGGKQFRAGDGRTIRVDRLPAAEGETVELREVLMVSGEDGPRLGSPLVENAVVRATVVRHLRGEKIRGFTYKAKKNQRRRFGHRQHYTELRIDSVTA
jgi:large subunit ribosomal protein L21